MKEIRAGRRQYKRLDTVFPVEFQFIDVGKNPTTCLFQGFTRNVGPGGMCIEAKIEKDRNLFEFIPEKSRLKLIINIPSSAIPTESYATIRWSERISEFLMDTYLFGVEYDEIDSVNQRMIEHYVTWLRIRPRVMVGYLLLALTALFVLVYLSVK